MDTKEKIALANQILNTQQKVKILRQDNSILERRENSIIITDDNRELIMD